MKSAIQHIATLALLITAATASAQVGRHELPRDTTQIGGQQQEEKMIRMDGKDDLMKSLVSLRDSVDNKLNSLNNNGSNVLDVNKQRQEGGAQELTKFKAQLGEAIDKLGGKDMANPEVLKQAQAKLEEVQKGFAKYRKDFKQ